MADQFLTKKEVASRLRVTEKTIDRYRKNGSLAGCKIGRRVLFYESQLSKAVRPEKRSEVNNG